jgi:hypothetical protein
MKLTPTILSFVTEAILEATPLPSWIEHGIREIVRTHEVRICSAVNARIGDK